MISEETKQRHRGEINACGGRLSLKMIGIAYGNSWYEFFHPTEIRAEGRTLRHALRLIEHGRLVWEPGKYAGATLIEDATVPPGELVFHVEAHPELSTRLINCFIEDEP